MPIDLSRHLYYNIQILRVIGFLEEPDVRANLLEPVSKLGVTMIQTGTAVKNYKKVDGVGSLVALIGSLITLMGFSSYLIYVGYNWLQTAKTFEEPGIVIDMTPGIRMVALGALLVLASLVYLGFTVHDSFKKNSTSK